MYPRTLLTPPSRSSRLPAATYRKRVDEIWDSIVCESARWGDAATATIRLYPKPDAVYTIGTIAILRPAVLTANADVPLFPADFAHRILVPYAAAILLEQEGGAEAGADYERRMSRYREGLRDLITAHGTGKRPTFNVVAAGAFDHLPGSGSVGW